MSAGKIDSDYFTPDAQEPTKLIQSDIEVVDKQISVGMKNLFTSTKQVEQFTNMLFLLRSGPEELFIDFLNHILSKTVASDETKEIDKADESMFEFEKGTDTEYFDDTQVEIVRNGTQINTLNPDGSSETGPARRNTPMPDKQTQAHEAQVDTPTPDEGKTLSEHKPIK